MRLGNVGHACPPCKIPDQANHDKALPSLSCQQMKVKELYVHPVKSLGGISVDKVNVDEHGIHNDRVYLVGIPTEEEGRLKMLTQREFAPMSLVQVTMDQYFITIRPRDGKLALRLPLEQHIAQIASTCSKATVQIWGQDAIVYDVGEITGFKQWWKAVFGDSKYPDATIVVPEPRGRRSLGELTPEDHREGLGREVQSSFQDLYPGHLLSIASLNELNQRLLKESQGKAHKVTARNFRPNIVVDAEEAYDEDFWEIFKTGNITWYTAQLCPRCPIPTIDTETGQPSKLHQPTKTLKKYRKLEPRDMANPAFGISISNKETSGVICVGDQVQVLQTSSRY